MLREHSRHTNRKLVDVATAVVDATACSQSNAALS